MSTTTLANLRPGQRAIIKNFSIESMPPKLMQMGCLLGSCVTCIQLAPMGCPMYLNVDDTFVAVRKETACLIEIDVLKE